MNIFQHSAHPVLHVEIDVEERSVERCLHMISHSSDKHSMKAVQLNYVMTE